MEKEITLYCRPIGKALEDIINLTQALTGEWFTDNVPEDTRRDLLFQDALCLLLDGEVISFIVFTSWEGSMYITLMGTHPNYRNKGYGSELINHFFEHISTLDFAQIVLLTVPPEVKPIYQNTIDFYIKHGFDITRHYNEIWKSGAIELVKILRARQVL